MLIEYDDVPEVVMSTKDRLIILRGLACALYALNPIQQHRRLRAVRPRRYDVRPGSPSIVLTTTGIKMPTPRAD